MMLTFAFAFFPSICRHIQDIKMVKSSLFFFLTSLSQGEVDYFTKLTCADFYVTHLDTS